MPFDAPKSLSDDEVYAVTAYILHRNGLVIEDEVLNEANLADVQMPNRGNFIDLWVTQKDEPY
jgi:cytochrome c